MRVYIGGLSKGGHLTWLFAEIHGEAVRQRTWRIRMLIVFVIVIRVRVGVRVLLVVVSVRVRMRSLLAIVCVRVGIREGRGLGGEVLRRRT